MPRLDFYADYQLFVKVKLMEADVILGRGDDCTVQLPHERVSRHHAIIRNDEQGYWIEDSSRNGTRVNDRMIDEPTLLQPGDRIYIERYVIVYRPDDAPAESRTEETTQFDT